MFQPVETADGSSTFYSETFGEWFHSKQGALGEAQKTYVKGAQLTERAAVGQVHILDVCYGLGYNTAAALDAIWQVNDSAQVSVQGLEIDLAVPRSAIAQGLTQSYSAPVQQALCDLANCQVVNHPTLTARLWVGDARQQIQSLVATGWQADTIFFDPFSPPNCPQLWTVEFFEWVVRCLNTTSGVLVTYSCAAAVRAAMQQCGLVVGELDAGGRRWPGTIACFPENPQASALTLSQQAQEHLQTRAAVPYRDPDLTADAQTILKARSHAQQTSDLLPTGPWRKRWKAIADAQAKAELG